MASLVITVTTPRADVSTLIRDSSAPREGVARLANYLERASCGFEVATIAAQYSATNPVAASATITCASVAVDDTVTIGNTVLTAKASPSTENQFSQAGSNTADGASLAAVINVHSVLSLAVAATASNGVVTVTALQKGVLGNHVNLTSSDGATLAVTGSGHLTGGTGGATSTAQVYTCG